MKIKILEDGKIKKMSTEEILSQQSLFMKRICYRWKSSFSFDRSINEEDLYQELLIKLIKSKALDTYDYRKSGIKTFIYEISKNFFINKKIHLLSKENHPTDIEGKMIAIKSIYDVITGNDLIILDTIESNEYTPEQELKFEQLVVDIKKRLNKITYTPRGFTPRLRTFCEVLFDSLFYGDEKFLKAMLFDYKCRSRYAISTGKKLPNKLKPLAESMARYFNVDKRAINLASRLIKKAIKDHIKTTY